MIHRRLVTPGDRLPYDCYSKAGLLRDTHAGGVRMPAPQVPRDWHFMIEHLHEKSWNLGDSNP